jgi:hypothetical protein
MLVKADTQDKKTSTALNNPLTTLNKPGSTIESDPTFYKYHPQSSLALGRSFDHKDVTRPMRPALTFTEYSMDKGSPQAYFSLEFVTNEDQLDIAMSLDSKVEASYLAAKASGSSTFSMGFKVKKDSIVVVAKLYKDFGRYGIKEGACLVQDAVDLLGNPKSFVQTFGDRYVSIERRGASACVVISIESAATDLKLDFKNEFSGSGGWGKLSASAEMKFEFLFKQAVKQSRLSVEAVATGGDNIANLAQTIKGLKDTDTAISAIQQMLNDFLAQFTPDKGVPIAYSVSSLSQFKLDESNLDLWTDDKERELSNLVREYRMAHDALDAIPALREGSHVFNKLWPYLKELTDWIVSCEAFIESHIDELVEYHTALKNGHPQRVIQFPAAVSQYSSMMDQALTPPHINFGAPLNDAQIRAVLRAKRGDRYRVAKQFDSSLIGIALLMGVESVQFGLFTATEFVRYSDGGFRQFKEYPYDGHGSGLWYEEPNVGSDSTDEDNWVEWFAKHKGRFKLTAGWLVRDVAERVFEISIMDVEFESQNGTLIYLDIKHYF